MRWNCPHCGTSLALSDDKISTGWSFSRCYKCSGHALIRKAGVQLIKVDKAPPGETLLLPEAQEQYVPNVSHTQHTASHLSAAVSAPSALASTPLSPATRTASASTPLPTPLPELPTHSPTVLTRLLPVFIGLTGVAAIGSGIYLYFQGQTLIERARISVLKQAAPRTSPHGATIPTAAAQTLHSPTATSGITVEPESDNVPTE